MPDKDNNFGGSFDSFGFKKMMTSRTTQEYKYSVYKRTTKIFFSGSFQVGSVRHQVTVHLVTRKRKWGRASNTFL